MSLYYEQDATEQAFEQLHNERRLMKAKAVWSNKAADDSFNPSYTAQQAAVTYTGENIYKTYVFSEKLTLSEGQRVAVWDLEGRMKTHDGPSSVKLWRSFYYFLVRSLRKESISDMLIHT